MSIINLENITKELIAAKIATPAIFDRTAIVRFLHALYLYLMNNCHELG